MMSSIELRLDSDVGECGDAFTGVVRAPSNVDAQLTVTVSLIGARGTTTKVVGPVSAVPHTEGRQRFEIPIPMDCPISFEGKSMKAVWTLEVYGAGQAVSEPVVVLPAGGLAVWARQAAPPPSATRGGHE